MLAKFAIGNRLMKVGLLLISVSAASCVSSVQQRDDLEQSSSGEYEMPIGPGFGVVVS